jgi:hypothetical protein
LLPQTDARGGMGFWDGEAASVLGPPMLSPFVSRSAPAVPFVLVALNLSHRTVTMRVLRFEHPDPEAKKHANRKAAFSNRLPARDITAHLGRRWQHEPP